MQTLRGRGVGNIVGVVTVLASASSVSFGLFPIDSVANCYPPSGVAILGGWLAVACGLLSEAGWLFLVARPNRFSDQIRASAATGFVIVVFAALPTLLASGAYTEAAELDRLACGMSRGMVAVIAISTFTTLIAGCVSYIVIRSAKSSRYSLCLGATAACTIWAGYVVLIHPF
jgi:hypothetical protein